MLKTISVTTAPPMRMAVVMPITVTTGTSALRKAWHVGHHPRGEALGAGGADVVLLQHLEHAGAARCAR